MWDAVLVILSLAVLSAAILAWGFRTLPGERWQVLASIPWRKDDAGQWTGVNLTWYGILSANACVIGVLVLLLLAGSVGMTRVQVLLITMPLITIGFFAASGLARAVERKSATLTIGGAVFVGTVLGPPVLLLGDHIAARTIGVHLPIIPLLAAMAIAYVFGEGFGRLACISYGCCYGRPLDSLQPRSRSFLEKLAFTFHGPTKKICYASNLAGVKVVPIQAITATVLIGVGLIAMIFFAAGWFLLAFAFSFLLSQLWRVWSETLRADERGGGRISTYQKMAFAGIVYAAAVLPLIPAQPAPQVDMAAGVQTLLHSTTAVAIQVLWIGVFLFTGLSRVTGSSLSFHVHKHRV